MREIKKFEYLDNEKKNLNEINIKAFFSFFKAYCLMIKKK